MTIIYFDSYYTVIRNRNDKEIVIDDEYEKNYNNYNDFITPNHYIGRRKIMKYQGREIWDLIKIFSIILYYIYLETRNWIAANVMFVILIFIERLM